MRSPSRNDSSANGVVWMALGALVGVTAGLLLAPDKGAHTRRRIADRLDEHRQTLLDSGSDVFARGRELFEKGREIAQETADMFERGRRMAEQEFDEQHIAREIEREFSQET